MVGSKKKSIWKTLITILPGVSGLLSLLRDCLVEDYKILENQNSSLQKENKQLREIVEGQKQITGKLEEKLRNRNNELEKSLQQLQDLDTMKSYFLSITSHELRTPLTIIKGALDLIQTEKKQLGPERFDKYLGMAQKNVERLILLLDELLDLSRLEFGQLKLDLNHVDLVRLIRESVEEFRDEADHRMLDINSQCEKNPPWIIGDQGRLKQILNNLISNALKFTPANGQIVIAMKTSGRFMEIIVEDTGIGISQEEQKQIFSKFHQGNYTLTREAGGVGLGLAIVNDLVELHDGKIWVESEPGQGSKFHVYLPLRGPSDPDKVGLKKSKENWNPPLVLKKKHK